MPPLHRARAQESQCLLPAIFAPRRSQGIEGCRRRETCSVISKPCKRLRLGQSQIRALRSPAIALPFLPGGSLASTIFFQKGIVNGPQ